MFGTSSYGTFYLIFLNLFWPSFLVIQPVQCRSAIVRFNQLPKTESLGFSSEVFTQRKLKSHLITSDLVSKRAPKISSNASTKSLDHRLPQAIIIGVKKAGTRALLEYLKLNTLVKGPGPEVHYFDRHYARGHDWYRRQMPLSSADQLTIEKTPSYFVTKDAPKRVADLNPNMKLIVVVRDPVIRALSDYAQTTSKRPNMPPFEQLALRQAKYNSEMLEVNPKWSAIRLGLYARFLRRWLEYFSATNILIVSGEELILNPAEETNRVERFLGLTPQIRPEHFQFNETKGFPCLLKETENGSHEPRCLGKTKGRLHPEIDSKLLEQLRHYYQPHNQQFFKLIGRTFAW